ncbi:MAG: hypothetical protein WBC97_10330 [Gemmatimonadales bacterium]
MKHRGILSLVLAAGIVAPLAAQGPCADKGAKLPAPGSWASYNATMPGRDGASRSTTFRMAYLGHEAQGDRLEIQMSSDRGQMIMQMVVDGFPYAPSSMKQMVMKMGDRPAMKVGAQMMQMMQSRAPNGGITAEMCSEMQKVGTETVTVPAGSFSATHWHSAKQNTDVWVSPDVPFVVQVKGPNNSMELTAKGTGAKSAITETPQDMGSMMGGQRQN